MPEFCFSMKYIRLNTTDPYYNLAVEEYLFRHAEEDIFMLWQNEPTVVCGKNQNVYAEVDTDLAAKRGIHITRRITGGGAVYHDLGNVNYTFISVGGEGRPLDFEYFTRPIRSAIEALGVACKMSDRNDIECEGGKFSGNAQHAEGGRILHHGTLLFDTDFSVLGSVLKVDKEKLAYRAVKSVRARVVNLRSMMGEGATLDAFLAGIEKSVSEKLGAEPWELPESEEIQRLYERNRSAEWIFSDKRYLTSYEVQRKKKYPFGLVEAHLTMERNRIEAITILGDFFGVRPVEELEKALVGMEADRLSFVDPSPYISGMTFEDLCDLLK